MNKTYYTKPKKNINGYNALLNSAIDKVEQAIDHRRSWLSYFYNYKKRCL